MLYGGVRVRDVGSELKKVEVQRAEKEAQRAGGILHLVSIKLI